MWFYCLFIFHYLKHCIYVWYRAWNMTPLFLSLLYQQWKRSYNPWFDSFSSSSVKQSSSYESITSRCHISTESLRISVVHWVELVEGTCVVIKVFHNCFAEPLAMIMNTPHPHCLLSVHWWTMLIILLYNEIQTIHLKRCNVWNLISPFFLFFLAQPN